MKIHLLVKWCIVRCAWEFIQMYESEVCTVKLSLHTGVLYSTCCTTDYTPPTKYFAHHQWFCFSLLVIIMLETRNT